jgi:hypothetical protein
LHHQDIEILILSKDKDTSRVSSELFFTIQDVDVLSLKSTSEIPININITLSTSLLLKELIVDSISLLAERPLYLLVTFCQSTESLKVPPFATSSLLLETRALTPDALALMPPLLDTPMMAAEPESDSHQEPERPFPVSAEPQSVSLPVEAETKSQS